MVCSNSDVTRCLSLIDGYLNAPMRYTIGSLRYGTPEAFTKKRLDELGLAVRRFPRTLFTAAAVCDSTRWSLMSDKPDATFHTRFKYWDEYAEAKAQCGKCKATTRSSAEPYCCGPSERFGLLHAAKHRGVLHATERLGLLHVAEQVLRKPLFEVHADGGCVYNRAGVDRACRAAIVVLLLIIVIIVGCATHVHVCR
jgi:hypothetical protein